MREIKIERSSDNLKAMKREIEKERGTKAEKEKKVRVADGEGKTYIQLAK